jgi:hypothetical protein
VSNHLAIPATEYGPIREGRRAWFRTMAQGFGPGDHLTVEDFETGDRIGVWITDVNPTSTGPSIVSFRHETPPPGGAPPEGADVVAGLRYPCPASLIAEISASVAEEWPNALAHRDGDWLLFTLPGGSS